MIGVLILLMLASAGLRWKGVDDPPTRIHRSSTMTAMTLGIWHEEGAWRHRFRPVMTFPREADRFVRNFGMGVRSPGGIWYYTGFPPLAFLVPHGLFRLLGVVPDIPPLRIFNVAAHLVATLFLFVLLRRILPAGRGRDPAALSAAALFLFLAPALFFFGDFYSFDTFVHFPWLLGILLTVRLAEDLSRGRLGTGPLLLRGAAQFAVVPGSQSVTPLKYVG